MFEQMKDGKPWSKLTEQQKHAVETWYGRKPVGTEKADFVHYFFDDKGKCMYSS